MTFTSNRVFINRGVCTFTQVKDVMTSCTAGHQVSESKREQRFIKEEITFISLLILYTNIYSSLC